MLCADTHHVERVVHRLTPRAQRALERARAERSTPFVRVDEDIIDGYVTIHASALEHNLLRKSESKIKINFVCLNERIHLPVFT